MFSLEDQIDVYADTQFNAEQHAQFFFSTHAETDVPRQLNELAGVQVSYFLLRIETMICPFIEYPNVK